VDWTTFLNRFADRPLFHTSMLAIFGTPSPHRQVQLARWTKAGKLTQVRRGWYLIAPPWRKKEIPIPYIANHIVNPSYLSLEWALQYYDMIPEYVPNPTSITTERGIRISALDTLFIYHHIKPAYFNGFRQIDLDNHNLNIALPEKALFDKLYIFLQKNRFSVQWLDSLRLQNIETFNFNRFESYFSEVKGGNLKKILHSTLLYLEKLKGEEM
jgi:hypothetical protein